MPSTTKTAPACLFACLPGRLSRPISEVFRLLLLLLLLLLLPLIAAEGCWNRAKVSGGAAAVPIDATGLKCDHEGGEEKSRHFGGIWREEERLSERPLAPSMPSEEEEEKEDERPHFS